MFSPLASANAKVCVVPYRDLGDPLFRRRFYLEWEHLDQAQPLERTTHFMANSPDTLVTYYGRACIDLRASR
jgi:hypothetical protein